MKSGNVDSSTLFHLIKSILDILVVLTFHIILKSAYPYLQKLLLGFWLGWVNLRRNDSLMLSVQIHGYNTFFQLFNPSLSSSICVLFWHTDSTHILSDLFISQFACLLFYLSSFLPSKVQLWLDFYNLYRTQSWLKFGPLTFYSLVLHKWYLLLSHFITY